MQTRNSRVSQGGLFHSHKVQYSKETQGLINRLIEESRLSILQRQTLKESVKRGEPLPGPQRSVSARNRSASANGRREVLVPPAPLKRRSFQAIVKSGAYQREAFDPPYNSTMKDREAEKQKLQSLMTYGKDVPPDFIDKKPNPRLKNREEEITSAAFFDHLVEEIKDRLEFLQEMEALGQVKAYQTVIEQEIASKMRQLAKIDQDKFLKLSASLSNLNSGKKKLPKETPEFKYKNNIFPDQ